ncbi:MAG: YafY family transcriptional regulator [Lachnospiraceae bacterium]|nr:YafY family transcriptional regulator [Lachnospiraceae bacterium]
MLERLISMIYILMNKGTVTAGELAERFEVSTRTIYRDIEALSIAGIPVYCKKGKNGGISLTEEFVLNKMLITKEEQQEILSALVGLKETEVSDGNKEEETLKKLGEFFQAEPVPWVNIDLSDWSGLRKQMYEDIKRAILTRHVIEFDYYGQNRPMSHRVVEPIQLQFKEYTWYLRAYCRERKDFRTFKLFRMQRLEVQEETFVPKREPSLLQKDEVVGEAEKSAKTVVSTKVECQTPEQEFPVTPLTIWIDKKEAYRIYDRFDESELEQLPDGNFLAHCAYPLDEWVYSLILWFGPSAKVLEPEFMREEVQNRIKKMMENYN